MTLDSELEAMNIPAIRQWFSLAELCAFTWWPYSRAHTIRLCHAGLVMAFRIGQGRKYRITKDELQRLYRIYAEGKHE